MHERDRADRPLTEQERQRANEQHLARRPEERELALGRLALERPLDEAHHQLLGDRVGVARLVEPVGGCVAVEHRTVGVHHDDAVGDTLQGSGETIALVLDRRRPVVRRPARRR